MAEVKWTPQAADDLEAVCLFIARDSAPLAAIFADRILRAVERLAGYPKSGRAVPELGNENIREIIVGNYRVIYRLRGNDVQLLTLHHGARSFDPARIPSAP